MFIDPSFCLGTFVGHTDIVWQVKAHYEREIIASISADATVKIWNTNSQNPLLSSWTGNEEKSIVPTSFDFVPNNPNQMIVSFNDSSLRLYDMEKGTAITTFDSQATYGNECDDWNED